MGSRLADACPFVRPFPDGFDACPAYQQTAFLALDTQYRPLRVVNTCRHLEARSLPGLQAGYYASCGLGDLEGRRAWVQQVEQRRLEGIRALGRDMAAGTSQLAKQLWMVKGEQLRALRTGESTSGHTRRLRRLVKAYEAEAARFFQSRSAQLGDLQLPEAACVALIHEVLHDWVAAPSLENSYRPSDRVLARFPADVRVLLRPNAVRA